MLSFGCMEMRVRGKNDRQRSKFCQFNGFNENSAFPFAILPVGPIAQSTHKPDFLLLLLRYFLLQFLHFLLLHLADCIAHGTPTLSHFMRAQSSVRSPHRSAHFRLLKLIRQSKSQIHYTFICTHAIICDNEKTNCVR